jgi:HlyD family secretion protein
MKGVKSRTVVIAIALLVVGAFFTYAFWPRALSVDMATIERGAMMVTIDEEAKTRVHDAFVVSAPVAGRLLRVDVEAGDAVVEAETVVARITPANPSVLDIRTEEQAKAAVDSAEAALILAKADVDKATADKVYTKAEVERARDLRPDDAVSQSQLDAAERAWRAASAALDMAKASVAMREADLKNARAMLMTFSEAEELSMKTNPHPREVLSLRAPISGRVLRVIQESETVLQAGAPVLEIGDPRGDLEVVAELLSTDAVKVQAGDRVIIQKWGGDKPLEGVVERIEPWGYTKFSALGVEEQRVNAIIRFSGDGSARSPLGHGYRAEVRIVVWEDVDALKVPASALFRSGDKWSVFKVTNGRAQLIDIEIGESNGSEAATMSGLSEGDEVILYPGNQIIDGARVKKRAL